MEPLLGETSPLSGVESVKGRPRWVRWLRWPEPGTSVVALMAFAYTLYLSRLSINNHNGYGTSGFDLGLYDQGLWLLSRFRAPFVTIMGRNLFGDHASFILLPLVPFYWFGAGSSFLLFIQSAALGISALPVYFTARRLLHSSWAACGLAFAWLAHPALAWTNYENFHPDSFLAPLLTGAICAMVSRRWRTFATLAILASMVKEDAILVVLPLAIYAWWNYGHDPGPEGTPDKTTKRNRTGLRVAGFSVMWTGIALILLRRLNSVGSLNAWRIPFGGPTGVIKTMFKEPGKLWNYLIRGIQYPGDKANNHRVWYVWKLFSPVLFLAALAPAQSLLFLFVVGINVISNFYYQYNIQYHYTAAILPGLAFATAVGISRIRRHQWKRLAIVGVIGASMWAGYLWGPTPLSALPASVASESSPWVVDGKTLIRKIPADATIAAFYGYIPHLGHRVKVYQFPVPWSDSYYGLPEDETAKIRPLIKDIEWVLVRDVEVSSDQVKIAFQEMTRDFELVGMSGTSQLYRRKG